MARKCTKKDCKKELPSKKNSDMWQEKGFCNIECMTLHAHKLGIERLERKRKADEAGMKKRRNELKKKVRDEDRSYWLKKAQQSFNAYIRHRDSELPCISCQRHHQGQYHAGHYRTVGGNPELRFYESNCHKQCSVCNNHLSGNITDYRINLVKKIGIEKVEWIEGPHSPKKYTIDELKAIDKKYRELVKTPASGQHSNQ